MDDFYDALEQLNGNQLQIALYTIKCVERSLEGFDFVTVNQNLKKYFNQEVSKRMDKALDKDVRNKPNVLKIIQFVIDSLWCYYDSQAEIREYPLFTELKPVKLWLLKGKNWRNWGDLEERADELELFTRSEFYEIFDLPATDALDEVYALYTDESSYEPTNIIERLFK